ncbi:hypothetical protein F3N42_12640 [Marinihelvus fidelis]|uniref:Uncharacterized protein n=1 Tax=Marinihelvus fidelis TaxID=2613842 RepID=A0A5N0T6N1_9GAMM|nr:hypothetical protein [Marinihelvus fidelis]KAA9130532.1 hypothetical protein F3N42_12640 [Marinihelvus fidelis]
MLLLISTAFSVSSDELPVRIIDIDDGDANGFVQVLCDAADFPGHHTVVRLAERGHYTVLVESWRACRYGGTFGVIPVEPGAREVLGQLTIEGNNSVLDLEGFSGFSVHAGGWLTLEQLEIRNGGGSDVIANDGRADLQGVSLLYNSPGQGLDWGSPGQEDARATLLNRGTMTLRNVVVAGNTLYGVSESLYDSETPLADCEVFGSAGVLNEGSLIINNTSIFDGRVLRNNQGALGDETGCLANDLLATPGAETRVSNSIISSPYACEGSVVSLGYNTVRPNSQSPDGGCQFNGPGDRVAGALGGASRPGDVERIRQLNRFRFPLASAEGNLGNPEPSETSEASCELIDNRGYLRLENKCLRGAFDNRATPNLHPGLDGLWFDPENDGQYLRISHYGPGNILLMWNSFDDLGQPVWVYGFGGSGGQTVTVDAFVNEGVALVDGNIIGEAEALAWGTLSVTVQDCQTITFDYNPLDTSIVAQTQTLGRLTTNRSADCPEGPPLR